MRDVAGPAKVGMLPEEVLQVFRDWQHFALYYASAADVAAYEPLTFEATVAEWRYACELREGKRLGRYLNRVFAMAAGDKEWLQVFADGKLGAICQFIAARSSTRLPQSLSLNTMMTNDRMFKVLRARLIQAGLSLDGVKPSASLEPYVVQHFQEITDVINGLAPGAFPQSDIRWKIANPVSVLVSFVFIYLLFQLAYRYSASVLGSMLFTGVVCILLVKCWDRYHATGYFHDIETFGDLTRIMVLHRNNALQSVEL
jgi:hypothetical protein